MTNLSYKDSGVDFGLAFGEQLESFLRGKMSPMEAAQRLGVLQQNLNHYLREKEVVVKDKKAGTETTVKTRTEPKLEMLYLICTRLGFAFEYDGYRIRAERLDGTPVSAVESRQLNLFKRKFKLTEDNGDLRVDFNRPPGRITLSLSLKADAS